MSDYVNIKKYAEENNVPIMMDEGIKFLLQTIKKRKIKSILEVGTAIGYSAIKMASICDDIYVDTLEIDSERYQIAIQNITDHQLSDRIQAYLMDAVMFNTDKEYDLIFIDAAKSQYKKYMEHFSKNLARDGIYFFDNLNFHGMVDNPSLTKSRNTRQLVKKIGLFRTELLNNKQYNVEFYQNIGDGVAIVSVNN